MSDLALIISKEMKNCSQNLPQIKEFLDLMQIQKKEYSEFCYQGNGSVSLILKAKKNGKDEVALKVVERKEQTKSKIEAMKGRQAAMKDLSFSDYFVEVNEQFVLKGSDEQQSTKETLNMTLNSFFVQEMELFQRRLSEFLQQFKLDKKSPSESVKEILAIQILDAVNLLHQKQVTHGDIKPQNIFVSSNSDNPILLKLKMTSSAHLRNQSKQTLSTNENLKTTHSDVGITKGCIEQDLISLGILLLELDNINTFDSQTISHSEKEQLCNGKVFENHQLNRNSLLYNIACTLLCPQNNRIDIARTALVKLLESSEDYSKIPVFSVVIKKTNNSICLLNIVKIMSSKQQYLQVNSQDNEKINSIMNQFKNTKEQERKELTVDLLKNALTIMLDWEDFQGQFDVLGIGATGIVFGVENTKENRKSVLKLSLCTNKAEIIRQIGTMKICQTNNIVKFYGHRFFEDSNHNQFVVYEFERCKYSLKYHLEQQRIEGDYSQESKNLLMVKIMDSINFLHKNSIIHRDITLDRFLITENEQGQDIPKLNNFNHAYQLQDCCMKKQDLESKIFERQYYSSFNCIIRQYNNESLLYFAPERWENPYPTTYQTDSYSVGLCLILLDNYLVFSEDQLAQKFSSFSYSYDDIFQDNNILVINSNTEIYNIAKSLLSYQPKERKLIKDLIDKCTQYSCEYSNNSVLPISKQLQQVFMNITNSQGAKAPQVSSKIYPQQNIINLSSITLSQNTKSSRQSQGQQVLQCNIADLSNITSIYLDLYSSSIRASSLLNPLSDLKNLSNISLILDSSAIGPDGAQTILRPLSSLINLSSILLEFYDNAIGHLGAKYLLLPLANLLQLSKISINLNRNKIGDLGASFLLRPLSNLTNLSVLQLKLQSNQIGDIGASSLLTPLKNSINLSNIFLSVANNSIGNEGAKNLLHPLANLLNLTSISLNLDSNQIEDEGTSSLLNPLTNLINLRIISINLDSTSIGPIGASSLLCPLVNLVNLLDISLDLAYTQIGDNGASSLLLPLSELKSLQSISVNLNSNSIEAAGGQSLLSPLSKLINLTSLSLDLWCNQIGEIGGSTILLPLANLKNLTSFQLNINSSAIGDTGAQSLLTPLTNIINLTSISLEMAKNLIGDIGASTILTPLRNLLNLKNISLNLAMNLIESVGGSSLLSPLTNLVNLQTLYLNLYINWIGSTGAESLLLPLASLTNLSQLIFYLDSNQIGDIGAQCLLSPISNLKKLATLSVSLSNDEITPIGAQSLLIPLRNLLNLSRISLILDGNTIGDLGAQSLLCPLSSLKKLSNISVNLTDNQIGESGASSLLTPFSNLINLSIFQLLLCNNQIGNVGLENLLSPLKNLNNLSRLFLNLDDNSIENIGAQSLLSPIDNLTSLSQISLDLNYNQINDIGVQYLLAPLSKIINLSTISLNLNSNLISDIGIQSLLLPFAALANLQIFSFGLDNNSIDDIGQQFLFSFINRNLLDLEDLQLQIRYNSNTKRTEHLFKNYLKKWKDINVSD